jgi:uncharacterized membrane protein YoaK (UPF0700 family)
MSGLAGYVDAVGFLKLGGFFVSFMSGNSTHPAMGLANGSEQAAEGTGLIAIFVLGVVTGSSAGHFAKWFPFLLLWLGLIFGAVLGALVYPHLGLGGALDRLGMRRRRRDCRGRIGASPALNPA